MEKITVEALKERFEEIFNKPLEELRELFWRFPPRLDSLEKEAVRWALLGRVSETAPLGKEQKSASSVERDE